MEGNQQLAVAKIPHEERHEGGGNGEVSEILDGSFRRCVRFEGRSEIAER